MSGDEVFVMIVSGLLGVGVWLFNLVRLSQFRRHGLPAAAAQGVVWAPLAGLVLVFWVLRTLASHDVREDGRYLIMYGLMGAAWLMVAPAWFLPGISVRDDFLERRNASAAYAVLGFMLASALCFAGGNIGDGPGWWVVVFCAALATLTMAGLWAAASGLTGLADRITIDRDPAIGLRVAGFFVGCGLILGRAVAGDWESFGATLRDFAGKAWPVLILLAGLIAMERMTGPRFKPEQIALMTRGVLPALFYVAAGLIAVMAQGAIE